MSYLVRHSCLGRNNTWKPSVTNLRDNSKKAITELKIMSSSGKSYMSKWRTFHNLLITMTDAWCTYVMHDADYSLSTDHLTLYEKNRHILTRNCITYNLTRKKLKESLSDWLSSRIVCIGQILDQLMDMFIIFVIFTL